MGLSAAWLWVGAGVALAALEMVVPSFLLLWPGAAALAVGLVLFVWPGLGVAGQAILFAVLAVGFTLAGRAWVISGARPPRAHPGLNQRGRRMVGHRGRARGAFVGGRGSVEIDGELWQARSRGVVLPDGAVEVVGADGAELVVEPR